MSNLTATATATVSTYCGNMPDLDHTACPSSVECSLVTVDVDTAARIADVREIGAAEGKAARKTSEIVPAVIANVPAEYDWNARGAVPAAIHAWATGNGAVPTPAATSGGDKSPTNYGIGVDRLRKSPLFREAQGKTGAVKAQNLLTGLGIKTLADMSDEELLAAVRAELTARAPQSDGE